MRRAWRIAAGAALAGWAALVLFAHPWFAKNEPTGAPVLVVEGWIPDDALAAVARLWHMGRYERLFVTGTMRPYAYHLSANETLELRAVAGVKGKLVLRMDGLPGAQWACIADDDTLLQGTVGRRGKVHRVELPRPVHLLRVVDRTSATPTPGAPVLFVGHLAVNGTNAHALPVTTTLIAADGTRTPGRPTHAEDAIERLVTMGIPRDRMVPVPDLTEHDRTRQSARMVHHILQREGIARYDVVTLGVHARRTHAAHLALARGDMQVGVIALPDPQCPRWTWWLRPMGWARMVKEVMGVWRRV